MKKLTTILLALIIALSASSVVLAEEQPYSDKYEKYSYEVGQYRHDRTQEEKTYGFSDHEVLMITNKEATKKILAGELVIDKDYFFGYDIGITDVIGFVGSNDAYYMFTVILDNHDCKNVLHAVDILKKDDNFSTVEQNYFVHYESSKNENPIKVSTAIKTVKYSKVKKAKQTVAPITVKKAKGKVSYKRISGSKKLTLKSNGKIVVKKGTKKGTYSLKVKITAQGTTKYKSKSKNVTVKIKVK